MQGERTIARPGRAGIAASVPKALAGLILAMAMASASRAAVAGPYTIALDPSYFSGRFGTSKTIRIYDMPLVAEYHRDNWRVRVEIPFIAIAGRGVVAGNSVVVGNQGSAVRSGPGDIWVEVKRRLNRPLGLRPSVEPYVKVKIPVASYDKGLGTGRFDEEAGVLLTWRAMRIVFPYLRVGYRHVGAVPGLHLRNIVTFEPGISAVVTPRQYASLLVIGHTPIQAGRSVAAAAVLVYDVQMNSRLEFQAFLSRGLTAESALFGAGLGVKVHF